MKRLVIFLTLALVGNLLAFRPAAAAPQPPGTNIVSSGTVFQITADGQRRPYTSAGAFLSYGFNNWSTLKPASGDDLALPVGSFIPPRDGRIICSDRGADLGTCYLITNGKKSGFVSAEVFHQLGFNFNNTTKGDVSFMDNAAVIANPSESHKPGTLINKHGTVYLVLSNGLSGIPNLEVLYSWGYSLTDAVLANTYDASLPQVNVLTGRQGAELMPTTYFGLDYPYPLQWTNGPANLLDGSYPASSVLSGGCFSVDPNNDQYLKISQTIVNINSQTFTIPQQTFLLNLGTNDPDIYIISNLPGEGPGPKIQFSHGSAGAAYQNYGFLVGSIRSQDNHIFSITHSNYNRVGTALQCTDYQKPASSSELIVAPDLSLGSVTIDNTTNPKPWYPTIAKFTLTANGGDVVITKMGFSANVPKDTISTLNVVDAANQQSIAILNGGSGDNSVSYLTTNTYSDGLLLIPKNTTRTLAIQANFSTYAKSANFKLGLTSTEAKQGSLTKISGLPAYSGNITLKGGTTTATTISLTSPQGGQTLTKGSTVTISWSGGYGDRKEEIRLISAADYPTEMIQANYSYYEIKRGDNISGNANSFSWNVDSIIAPGSYVIRILRVDPTTDEVIYYSDSGVVTIK